MAGLGERLQRLEEGFLGTLMGSLVLLAAAQIILRSLFSYTLPWVDPLIRHLVLWTGFLGATVACRLDKHIRIDALLRLVPARWTDLLETVGNLFSSSLCGLLVWVSIRFILDERAYATTSFLDIPTWLLQLIFPLAFAIMAVRFLLRGGRGLKRSLAGDRA